MEKHSAKEKIKMGLVPMGTIVAFALNKSSIPSGWLLCDGSMIPNQYQELITALGSRNTPNLAGRTFIGTGVPLNNTQSDGTIPNFDSTLNWPLSYTGGEFTHKLVVNEMPKHTHTINQGNFGLHQRSFEGMNDPDIPFEANPKGPKLTGTDITGNDQPHNNMPPYFAVNFIIFAGL